MYAPNMINPKENDGFIQGEQALLKKAKGRTSKDTRMYWERL